MVGGSPSIPASSTTKTGRHDIVDILLKVALNTINKSINQNYDKSIFTGIPIKFNLFISNNIIIRITANL